MTITSSRDFDGFILTGLYTRRTPINQPGISFNNLPSLAVGANQPFGQNFMCSFLHTHHSKSPKHKLTFTWRAPMKDTGCVSFMLVIQIPWQKNLELLKHDINDLC